MKLIFEIILALLKVLGLAASAKNAADERAAGAAAQRAEDYAREAIRIDKAARAGADLKPDSLPDSLDRDAPV